MDDEAALIARRVAMAPAAWFNAPADVDAYRRLALRWRDGTPTAPRRMARRPARGLLGELSEIAPPNRCRHPADLAASKRASVRRELEP